MVYEPALVGSFVPEESSDGTNHGQQRPVFQQCEIAGPNAQIDWQREMALWLGFHRAND
jgi:hypothetical protein